MDLAIKKAKNVGVGWVCANHSNHYGNILFIKYKICYQVKKTNKIGHMSAIDLPNKQKDAIKIPNYKHFYM